MAWNSMAGYQAMKEGGDYSPSQAAAMAGKEEGSYPAAMSHHQVATRAAEKASAHAHATGSKSAHAKAGKAAKEAKEAHAAAGNDAAAKHWGTKEKHHYAKQGTAKRNELVDLLTENGELCTNESDLLVLNQLGRGTLMNLFNAKTQGSNSDETGPYDFKSAVEVGGQRKTGGGDDVGEHDEKWDDETEDDADAGPTVGDSSSGGTNRGKVKLNSRRQRRLAVNRWLERTGAPQWMVDNTNRGLDAEEREAYSLVQHIVANVADDQERNRIGNRLINNTIDDLRERVALMGTVAPTQNYASPPPRSPIFLGQNAPAFNSSGGNGAPVAVLPLPTMNDFNDEEPDEDGDDDEQQTRNRRGRRRA